LYMATLTDRNYEDVSARFNDSKLRIAM
jgi:hypothetical protein